MVFLAILGAFLVWRRKRNKARAPPADIGPASEHEAVGGDSYIFEKDSKTAPPTTTTTVTAIKYPPELRDELARPEPTYKGPISPVDSPQPPLSPSPAYVEAAGPVPAEIDSSTQPTSAHGHAIPHPGLAEADSTVLSHNITSPLSELEQPSLIYHELPTASPPQSPPSGLASSSSAAAYPAYAPGPLSGNPVGDAEADDPELVRMKADLEALRAEKEQVQRLQSIEAREKELSRRIVDRELGVRRESGGPS